MGDYKMTKAMLLRVGIDSTTGGFLAPLFKDGSFLYIPIPDPRNNTSETKNYDNFKEYVPEDRFYFENKTEKWELNYKEAVLHNDPNFESKTYGDPTNKGRNLLKLRKGDYLIFWEAFYPFTEKYKSNKLKDILETQKKCYKVMAVIGYFKLVENPIKCSEKNEKEIRSQFKDNAHLLRNEYDKDTIIVNGDCLDSQKLPKAVPLAWKYDKILRGYVGADYLDKFGLNNKRFQQSSDIHFLHDEEAEEFIKFIKYWNDTSIINKIFEDNKLT